MLEKWMLLGVSILLIIVGLILSVFNWQTRKNHKFPLFPYNFLVSIFAVTGSGIGLLIARLPAVGISISHQVITFYFILIGISQVALGGGAFVGVRLMAEMSENRVIKHWIFKWGIPLMLLIQGSISIIGSVALALLHK